MTDRAWILKAGTPEELTECRKIHLKSLQDAAEQLEGLRFAMYEYGVWTGFLNALDENSPHCVHTEVEIQMMHAGAMAYLNGFRHGYMAHSKVVV